MLKILITGGTGFIGQRLCRHLLAKGHTVSAIGTRTAGPDPLEGDYTYIQADTARPGDWQQAAADADLIFNLAGKSIFHRWSRKYKKQLYDSRILSTRNLVAAIKHRDDQTLISTSAVGYYGNGLEKVLTESSAQGDDYLSNLSADWESEALRAGTRGTRVAIARLGIVMGAEGGALHTMLTAFKSFIGGPLGSGKQWVAWVHIQDVVRALAFLAEQSEFAGPFNICAPTPIRNKEMSALIGHTIGRPSKISTPTIALKLAMGELADVLLGSQRAIPERLTAAGFEFEYPDLQAALENLLAAP